MAGASWRKVASTRHTITMALNPETKTVEKHDLERDLAAGIIKVHLKEQIGTNDQANVSDAKNCLMDFDAAQIFQSEVAKIDAAVQGAVAAPQAEVGEEEGSECDQDDATMDTDAVTGVNILFGALGIEPAKNQSDASPRIAAAPAKVLAARVTKEKIVPPSSPVRPSVGSDFHAKGRGKSCAGRP